MHSDHPDTISATELKSLASQTREECTCSLSVCSGWESVSDNRWPKEQLTHVGNLRAPLPDGEQEATYEEFHPNGTRYESPDAPISLKHFPFNRCDVFQCGKCSSTVLKYTEFGGYYVDHRVRLVKADLVVID